MDWSPLNTNSKRKKLEFYGLIPTTNLNKYYPECRHPLRIITDRERYAGNINECSNHGRKRRFGFYSNTFFESVRIKHNMAEHRTILIIFPWLDRLPITKLSEDNDFPVKQLYTGVGRLHEWRHFGVVGDISRTTKKMFAIKVQRRNQDTLLDIFDECIRRGYSVCGQGQINHSQNFVSLPRVQDLIRIPRRFHSNCWDKQWHEPLDLVWHLIDIHTEQHSEILKRLQRTLSPRVTSTCIGEMFKRKSRIQTRDIVSFSVMLFGDVSRN